MLCTCRYQFVAVCPVAARATTTQSITQSSITILHSRRLPQMLLLHDDIVAGRKEEQLPPQSLACSYCAFLHPSTPAPTLPTPMPITTTHQLHVHPALPTYLSRTVSHEAITTPTPARAPATAGVAGNQNVDFCVENNHAHLSRPGFERRSGEFQRVPSVGRKSVEMQRP